MTTPLFFETQVNDSSYNLQWSGRFRCEVPCANDRIAFDLPGRGGRVTANAAKRVNALWEAGYSAGEIQRLTGFNLV